MTGLLQGFMAVMCVVALVYFFRQGREYRVISRRCRLLGLASESVGKSPGSRCVYFHPDDFEILREICQEPDSFMGIETLEILKIRPSSIVRPGRVVVLEAPPLSLTDVVKPVELAGVRRERCLMPIDIKALPDR